MWSRALIGTPVDWAPPCFSSYSTCTQSMYNGILIGEAPVFVFRSCYESCSHHRDDRPVRGVEYILLYTGTAPPRRRHWRCSRYWAGGDRHVGRRDPAHCDEVQK